MTDRHTYNFFIWYPRSDQCINAHLGQENHIFRSVWRYMRQGRQFALMCSPGYFNRSRPFFPQSFNAPCSYKFINLFWSVGNLSISLATMDHFDSQFLSQVSKVPVFCKEGNFVFIFGRDFLISTGAGGNIQQTLLYEVRYQ